ncbi:hypothetical protein AVEN_224536-1 [Araneus ventricosus]|uniref:Uncharacterized protein n=1 Tax=Araneus ventricosus TaxID=182803 RepID=A0A4Y2SZY0_ARAVE|nr:hypothetical protein AVEN_224536-1 [Araneus ventricosus]
MAFKSGNNLRFELKGFSLVILTFRFEVTRGYFGTDLVIFNCGQMPWTTPEPHTPLQASVPHQREDVRPPTHDLQAHIRGGSSVKSGFESETLRPRSYH